MGSERSAGFSCIGPAVRCADRDDIPDGYALFERRVSLLSGDTAAAYYSTHVDQVADPSAMQRSGAAIEAAFRWALYTPAFADDETDDDDRAREIGNMFSFALTCGLTEAEVRGCFERAYQSAPAAGARPICEWLPLQGEQYFNVADRLTLLAAETAVRRLYPDHSPNDTKELLALYDRAVTDHGFAVSRGLEVGLLSGARGCDNRTAGYCAVCPMGDNFGDMSSRLDALQAESGMDDAAFAAFARKMMPAVQEFAASVSSTLDS